MPRVSRLRIYPVKSCRGYDVESAQLDAMGLVGDRRFQVIDAHGKPFTQRSHPALARVTARRQGGSLLLQADGVGEVQVPLTPRDDAARVTTEVWSSTGLQATATIPAADAFFSSVLATRARLAHAGSAFDRPVASFPDARVGFADGYPLLVISEASLADLNDRLAVQNEDAVAMEQFRPNLVVDGCSPYAEDGWPHLTIAGARFQSAGPCERCVMTTLDPTTGEKLGVEPLRTLASYRRTGSDTGVHFGQNLVNLSQSGTLTVGDNVTVEA